MRYNSKPPYESLEKRIHELLKLPEKYSPLERLAHDALMMVYYGEDGEEAYESQKKIFSYALSIFFRKREDAPEDALDFIGLWEMLSDNSEPRRHTDLWAFLVISKMQQLVAEQQSVIFSTLHQTPQNFAFNHALNPDYEYPKAVEVEIVEPTAEAIEIFKAAGKDLT